eukprot:2545381-Prymnesium_polylepis.1
MSRFLRRLPRRLLALRRLGVGRLVGLLLGRWYVNVRRTGRQRRHRGGVQTTAQNARGGRGG